MLREPATPIRSTALLMAAIAASTCCTNEPGAAKMMLECPERIHANESLPMTVTLQVGDTPICLWKGRYYTVELARIDSDRAECSGRSRWTAPCGTHILALLPLMPFILVGGWMDVADLGGRFDVVPASRSIRDQSTLHFRRPVAGDPQGGFIMPDESGVPHLDPWPTGRFRLKATLRNTSDRPFPAPPLFWQPYDHPLEATATIEILP